MEFFLLSIVIVVLFCWQRQNIRKRRETVIDNYRFPPTIENKIKARYPHLTPDQSELVIKGLREYFHVCNRAGRKMVSMPSQVVDMAWHEFILFTRAYQQFCRQGLGRFLHHVPAEAMTTRTMAQRGIKRAWRIACARDAIDPKTPSRLPLLFEIDTLLDIPDGFRYVTDCRKVAGNYYCAGDIGCAGGCAGSGGDDSGGDGDSGCGGGCGGD